MLSKVRAVLNNNVVLAVTESGQEFIALGQGIGFKHQKNDCIRNSEILRKYYSTNNKQQQDLIRLFNEIDYDVIQLTEMIISMAEKRLVKRLGPYLLINLADHISFSIQRYRQGLLIPSFISEEIRRFYKKEYEIGVEATNMVNTRYCIHLDASEASAIAFHIINASEGQTIDETRSIMTYVNGVIDIINSFMEKPINHTSDKLDRLILHLRYFFRNILFDKVKHVSNSELNFSEILKLLIGKNEKYTEIITAISDYISNNLDYELTDEDKLYLTIHIKRLFAKED